MPESARIPPPSVLRFSLCKSLQYYQSAMAQKGTPFALSHTASWLPASQSDLSPFLLLHGFLGAVWGLGFTRERSRQQVQLGAPWGRVESHTCPGASVEERGGQAALDRCCWPLGNLSCSPRTPGTSASNSKFSFLCRVAPPHHVPQRPTTAPFAAT